MWIANPNGAYEKVVGWMPKEMNNIYNSVGLNKDEENDSDQLDDEDLRKMLGRLGLSKEMSV